MIVLIRNANIRYSCLKVLDFYFNKREQNVPEDSPESLSKSTLKKVLNNTFDITEFFESQHSMVIMAFNACLQDKDIKVVKKVLDFILENQIY